MKEENIMIANNQELGREKLTKQISAALAEIEASGEIHDEPIIMLPPVALEKLAKR